MYVLIDCIFRADHISLYKLHLTYLCIIIPNYYCMYFIVVTHSVLSVVTYWQVLYLLWWISGILNKLLWLYTPVWYLVKLAEGWWKFQCCLVYLIVVVNNSLFFIANRRRERMYREGSGEILSLINNFLHESLHLHPIIILIILFCNMKTVILLAEWPKNIVP